MDPADVDRLRAIDPVELGARLRAARLAAGLTQRELGGQDASLAYVSRVESGARRPSARVLDALAHRLGTTSSELLLDGSVDRARELELDLAFVELAIGSGEAATADERSTEVLRRAREAAAPDVVARALLARARVLETLGRLDDAIEHLDELAATTPPGVRLLEVATALSRCLRESGDYSRAVDVAEAVRPAITEAGLEETDEAVQLVVTLAAAYYERGDTAHAVRLCRAAARTAEAAGSPRARAAAYWNASIMQSRRGDVDDALALARRALALLGEGDDGRNLGRLHGGIGIMLLRLDEPDLDGAAESLGRSAQLLRDSGASVVDLARNDVAIARLSLLRGEARAAIEVAEAARAAVGEVAPPVAVEALTVEGQAHGALGAWDEATARLREAVLVLSSMGADAGVAQLWFTLGELLAGAGDEGAALDAFRRAGVSRGLRPRAQASGVVGNQDRRA